MDYIHVKNLDKYYIDYKDRPLSWCKLYFSTINSDDEFMLLHETDKWRFFAFVMIELQRQKPTPIEPKFLMMKGFDLKARPISNTINALHNFVESVTDPLQKRNESVTQSRVEKSRVEKSRVEKSRVEETRQQAYLSDNGFVETLKQNPAYKGINIDKELAKMDAWFLTPKGKGRKKTRRFVVNWLNKIDRPMEDESFDERIRRYASGDIS